jgi:ring-1,2-phenylacetyl-CoA epoxidase subunit PaaC
MNAALKLVMNDFGDVFSYGNQKLAIEMNRLIGTEEEMKANWTASIEPVFTALQLEVPKIPDSPAKNGRMGEHTKDLDEALTTLSEVYLLDPVAIW